MKYAISALILALSACGPLSQGGLTNVFAERLGQITGQGAAAAAGPTPMEQATLLTSVPPGEAMLVSVIQRGLVAPMLRVEGGNDAGDVATFRSPGDITLSFRDTILVASRGFEADLMGADIDGIYDALRQGEGIVLRKHGYLDGLDNVNTVQLACQIIDNGTETLADLPTGPADLRLVKESCASETLIFENSYWLDDAGRIIRSRQMLSPQVGFIQTDWPLGL